VWQDLKFMQDGRSFYIVDARSKDDTHSPGYAERVTHLASIRGGAPCYLVMCTAQHVDRSPREIADFNPEEVFVGVKLLDTPSDFAFPANTAAHVRYYSADGATWILRGARIPISSLVT